MDATSLPPALARELADLRRRAFGPDADIAADPNALRRLEELERLNHAAPAAPADAALPRSRSAVPVTRSRPIRRRRWVTPSAIAAAVALIVGAGALAGSGRPHDTSIVATAAERQRLVDRVDLARIDMIGARLQPFADFESLWVWSATRAGSTCLLVGSGESDALRVECAEADTTAPLSVALRVGDQVRPALVGGLPAGSEVRFTMRDGAVSVTVQTADG